MAARNLITDVGMLDIEGQGGTYWSVQPSITPDEVSVNNPRILSFSASGSPAGQLQRVYGNEGEDTQSMAVAGRYVVARIRAFTNGDNGLGGWGPTGNKCSLGVAFWNHSDPDIQHGIVEEIPFGIFDDPPNPEFHDVELVYKITSAAENHRIRYKLELERGGNMLYVEAPSAELYIVDDLADVPTVGGGGGEPEPDEVPDPPTNVTVTDPTPSKLTVSWDEATDDRGVLGYNVYVVEGEETLTKVNPVLVQALSYTVAGLEPWTEYEFVVRAVDTGGQESEDSDPGGGKTALPGPELDGSPWDLFDALAASLAPRAAAYVGRSGDTETIAAAAGYVPVVAEYVRGYTRGRGFNSSGQPKGPLQAVIVAACSRLLTNPEQLSAYTTGDYSERPAVLNGWTLAELGVLRRYRKVSA